MHVVTRQPERALELAAAGFLPIVAEITRPETLPTLPQVDTVLFAVGFDRTSGNLIEQVYVEGLRNVLTKLLQPPRKLIYISSTGVFGQVAGDWVDEDSHLHSRRAPAESRAWTAERLLQNGQLADRAIILRLAGIYGPGAFRARMIFARGDRSMPPAMAF